MDMTPLLDSLTDSDIASLQKQLYALKARRAKGAAAANAREAQQAEKGVSSAWSIS